LGTNDTTRSSLRSIKKDYRALGMAVRDSGAQAVFSSVLPVEGKGFECASKIGQINKWLQGWCHSQRFRHLGHGNCFEKPGLLRADGVHLSEKGKSMFGHQLAKLVKRDLN